ncbi:MAG TPA: PadR family transcriptional regulator [Thermoanaerobaculia bacterium]|nr:PadR family transcriptional regulator [Thermoanaerobaculia bacterium]
MKNLDADARTLLPLSESTYLILASLVSPRHGYGIMQNVEEVSGGRVTLGPGTLYGALTNLLKQRVIRRVGEAGTNGDRRKIYALTPLGEKVLVLEGERLLSLSKIAHDVTKKLGGKDK